MLTEEKRPKNLSEICGQAKVKGMLTGWVKQYRDTGTADVFLITGPSGTGKTSLAHALAGELGVDQWSMEFISSGNCNIETVRGIVDTLNHSSLTGGKWKIVVVDEAHIMSEAAKNAWLSALENLPNYRVVIFTTTEPGRFDLVWRSRCKMLELQTIMPSVMYSLLQKAVPEGRTVPRSVIDEITNNAKGNMRAAYHALEQHLVTVTKDEDDSAGVVDNVIRSQSWLPKKNPDLIAVVKPKIDEPIPGVQYRLTGPTGTPSIAAGNSLEECVVLEDEDSHKKDVAARMKKMEDEQKQLREVDAMLIKQMPKEDCSALIVAELHENTSDYQSDYHAHRVVKTIVLAWRRGSRECFKQMRAAALLAEETKPLATAGKDAEHRENYSMGAGTYLKDGHSDSNGWSIRSRPLYDKSFHLYSANIDTSLIGYDFMAKPTPSEPGATLSVGDGFELKPGTKPGYVEIHFKAKPDEAVRAELKSAKFRWAMRNKCWYGLEEKLPSRYKGTTPCQPNIESPPETKNSPTSSDVKSVSAPEQSPPVQPDPLPSSTCEQSTDGESEKPKDPCAAIVIESAQEIQTRYVSTKRKRKGSASSHVTTESNTAVSEPLVTTPSQIPAISAEVAAGPKSWKVEVKTSGDSNWSSNAMRYPTQQDAHDAAVDLACRWMAVTEYRETATDDEVYPKPKVEHPLQNRDSVLPDVKKEDDVYTFFCQREGLGVLKTHTGWLIVHLASEMDIGVDPFKSPEQAETVMDKILKLADWTKGLDVVHTAEIGNKIMAILNPPAPAGMSLLERARMMLRR